MRFPLPSCTIQVNELRRHFLSSEFPLAKFVTRYSLGGKDALLGRLPRT
jgi:hypothetical protein